MWALASPPEHTEMVAGALCTFSVVWTIAFVWWLGKQRWRR